MTVSQPDGTVLHCFASGDEYFNYLHDENGFTIMQHPRTGYYVYAEKRDGKLVATNYVAGVYDPASKGLKPYALISSEEWMARRQAWEVPDEHFQNRAVNHGTLNNISIFIRFSDDDQFTNSYSAIDNMFNDVTEGAISLRSYFRAASYGSIEIPTTFYPGHNDENIISYQDTYPRSYFQPYDESTNTNGYQDDNERKDREFSLLERAVTYINDHYPVPTSLNIDYDNDGNVDNVCFIVKGGVGAWSSLLWPHKWSLYDRIVRINGKRVYTFNFQLSDATSYFNASVMCHEMNHSLSAPDLYHYYNGTNLSPVGPWDLMEQNANPPQHCGAYMKMKYGHWIDEIPEITQAGVYSLNPISSATPTNVAYKIPTEDPNQFYVLEYRDNTSLFETSLPGSGLLVYRINTSFSGNASYNPNSGIYDEVYLFRPGGSFSENGNLNSAHFSSNVNRTEFSSSTSAYPFFTDGTVDYNFMIYNITNAGSTISFTYGTSNDCEPPTNLVASVENNIVSLSWDAATNAVSYNIYRNGNLIGNTSGTTYLDSSLNYGIHTYLLKSIDSNGLLSTASETVSVTIAPDGSIIIGDGSSVTNDFLPSYSYYKYSLTQQIYTVEEIGGAGAITSIAFYNGGAEKTRTYDFYLKSTTRNAFFSTSDWETVSDTDKVFSGIVTMTANDWSTIVFDTPFFYDGTTNLVLVADDNSGAYTGSPHMSCLVFNAPSQAIRVYGDFTNYNPTASSISYTDSDYADMPSVKNQLLVTKVEPTTGTLNITVSASPVQGGTATGGGEFNFGEICTVNATVNEGYTFFGWTENGVVVSVELEYTFTVVQDRNLVALFTEGIIIGDEGTTTSPYLPSHSFYNYSLTQQIYTSEELGSAGMITGIAFYNSGSTKTRNYDIYMKATNKSAFSSRTDWETITASDLVFSGTVTMEADDWTNIILTTPLVYDGSSNLVIAVDDNTSSCSQGMNCRVFDVTTNQALYIYSDGTNYNPFSTSTYSGTMFSKKNQLKVMKSELGDCAKPTQFAATEIGPNHVVLSWIENGASEDWYISCFNEEEEYTFEVTNNPYTLIGLTPETTYTAFVIPACGVVNNDPDNSLMSNMIEFTTLSLCATPSGLEIENILHSSATLSWIGYQETYNLRYGVGNSVVYLSEDFEDGAIPAAFTNDVGYPWEVVTDDITGSYSMKSTNEGISNSSSTISATMTYEAEGTIEFDARCMGEGYTTIWDKCSFYIDNVEIFRYGANISGWNHYSFAVAAGEHTFTWSYSKDSSVNPTGDAFLVDNIVMSTFSITWAPTIEGISGATYNITGLEASTQYYAQVQGINASCEGGLTEWSEMATFTTIELTTVTQTVALAAGWNYVSFHVETTLDDLKAALVEALPETDIMIKGKSTNASYKASTHRWTGRLTSLDLSQSFRIQVATDSEITMQGFPIDPADHPATVVNGANWIAFPLNGSMSLTNAFAGFAVNNDVIKSKGGTSQYKNGRWMGSSLTTLEPGQGYIYKSASSDTRTLVFPASAK